MTYKTDMKLTFLSNDTNREWEFMRDIQQHKNIIQHHLDEIGKLEERIKQLRDLRIILKNK